MLFRTAIAAFTATAALSGAQAGAAALPEQIHVEYSGSVLVAVPVANITITAWLHEDTYAGAANFRAGGLLRWFDDTDINATTTGYRDNPGRALSPWRYEHFNHASGTNRTVGIDFEDGRAVPDVNPPFGSMGEPPASDEEREGALDPVTAMISIMLSQPQGERPCEGRIPVFDGKARYDLRLERGSMEQVNARGYRGQALRCRIFLEPISGYDEGRKPTEEDTARPINVWLADMEGAWVPVRFRARTRIGDATITATRVYAGPMAQ
ncbi:DUF3108 domain-containing protein [Alkalicaulis satelles]|uniref:DUF3108 domain-containing protein n=1 Tax=Alkalicaulis satelles TaxID=2609175 RepID=A0A5M6ZH94_9PROT|nr:DUF3108 domain-containing protein [Alkalicaulis satelles]KAA5803505.1 DUF3108 domain-containing protein [Alkalicaulis satelles]